jgi:hypothetical protein
MNIDSVSPKLNHIPVKPEKIRQPEPEVEQTITADQITEQPTEPQEDLKGVLQLLAEGHFKGVADLRLRIAHDNELEGVQLPEPSEPSGNGKAYEKFLAIYNELKAVPAEEIPTESTLPEEGLITEPIAPSDEIIETAPMEIPAETQEPLVIDLNMENSIFDIPQSIIIDEPIITLDILA